MSKKSYLLREQSGISLIEVLIAVFLVFMALTSLVVLVGEASKLNANARANQASALLAGQKMEQIRNTDFDNIGYTNPESGEPAGIYPKIETTVIGNTTYTIRYQIQWVDATETVNTTQDYKKVTISTSWDRLVGGNTQTSTYKLTSLIAQAPRRVPGKIINPPPPVLDTNVSPGYDAVVSGSSVRIKIDTAPDPGYLYSGLEIRIGGGIDGEKLTLQTLAASASQNFYWDTTLVQDGKYEVMALAYEARGGSSARTWYYYVNNHAPTETPSLSKLPNSETTNGASMRWNLINDGNEKVLKYELVRNSPTSATTVIQPSTSDPTVAYTDTHVTKIINTLNPWTIYAYTVRGESYGQYSPSSNSVSFVTLIQLGLSKQIQGNNRKCTLSWTAKPSDSQATKLDIYRKINNGATVLVHSISPINVNTWQDPYNFRSKDRVEYYIVALRNDGTVETRSPRVSITI